MDRSQYENYSLIGDEEGYPNAIMRFEMCLNDASANLMPQTCFNAFRNHRGEPIFFTIDAVSKAALTPEEMSYVSGLESRWESFRRASESFGNTKWAVKKGLVVGGTMSAGMIGISAGIIRIRGGQGRL